MKYSPITLELLRSKNACSKQVALFKRYFGDKPVPLNKRIFTKFGREFDIEWASMHLLNSKNYIEYHKVIGIAWSEYQAVRLAALTKYIKINNPAGVKHAKVIDAARVVYQKAKALAFLKIYKSSNSIKPLDFRQHAIGYQREIPTNYT